MKVLIAAGGTAGHINPALAIAGAIRQADPAAEIQAFAGRQEGMEYRLVTQAGYPFHHIKITGFQRHLSWQNIKRNAVTLYNLALSGPKAKAIIGVRSSRIWSLAAAAMCPGRWCAVRLKWASRRRSVSRTPSPV